MPALLALSAVFATCAPPAQAQQAPNTVQSELPEFQIAAGPLAPALRQLAGTAGIMLTFTAEQTDGKQTAGLQGRHASSSALALLLAGTGLQAVQLDTGAFVLRQAPR
ncbi:secretin and TonB N terminus short domain protein [Bordetella holmesii 41130]|nr:secretin and TonB N terminus short domain protein [Bordetella holmesii 41130]